MLRGRRIKGGGRRRRREGREGREGGGGRVSVVVSFPFRFFSSLYLLGGLEYIYWRRRKEKRGFKENF